MIVYYRSVDGGMLALGVLFAVAFITSVVLGIFLYRSCKKQPEGKVGCTLLKAHY